jgi:hypothetical protein
MKTLAALLILIALSSPARAGDPADSSYKCNYNSVRVLVTHPTPGQIQIELEIDPNPYIHLTAINAQINYLQGSLSWNGMPCVCEWRVIGGKLDRYPDAR